MVAHLRGAASSIGQIAPLMSIRFAQAAPSQTREIELAPGSREIFGVVVFLPLPRPCPAWSGARQTCTGGFATRLGGRSIERPTPKEAKCGSRYVVATS